MYQLNPEHQKQNGWACFDIAVGFERKQLIEFALKNIHLLEFRQLLASEIRHAAALGAVYMNLQDEENEKLAKEISELFMLADALNDKASKEQLEAQAFNLLESDVDIGLSQFSLPISMHTKQLQKIVNDYVQAHEKMRSAVATCNQALGYQEGKYLSLAELDRYFVNPDNQNVAYSAYQQARTNSFSPFESAFIKYCQKKAICTQYIQEYYAKRGWFSFQLSFNGENNTSMVDIAARMIGKNIVIHDIKDLEKILYPAKITNLEEIHIAFNGHDHFVGMVLKNKISTINQYRIGNSPVKKPKEVSKQLPPVLKPEDYSQNKRTDLLPGLAGSLYQGDATISYMLDGIEQKLHFDIRSEVGEADKWDDIKIVYADRKSGTITKTTYIQSKHGYDKSSFLLPANFYNKRGKAELTIEGEKLLGNTDMFTLPMYFDDWLRLKSNSDKKIFDKTEFVLFSNRSLCDQVVGFANCFEGDPLKLSKDFIKGNGIYAEESSGDQAENNQIDFRKELFKSLLNNSKHLTSSQLTLEEKNSQIRCFLRKLVFRLGEKHLDDIERENKKRVAKLYPNVNAEAIYYAFRFEVQRWLRDKDTATSFTDETINKFLNDAATQYLVLGQYIGTTSHQLREILVKPEILLRRDKLAQSLTTCFDFKSANQYQLSAINGLAQSGKSFAVAQFLEQKVANKELIPGEFLYLNANDLEDFEVNLLKISVLKFVVIDLDKCQPSEYLVNVCLKAEESKVKVVLIIRDKYVEQLETNHKLVINNRLSVPYLTGEEADLNIKQLDLLESGIRIAHKMFSFVTDYLILRPVLQFPNRFCEMAISSVLITAKSSLQSNMHEDVYIKQEINEQLPIFSLIALLKINTHLNLHLFIDNINITYGTIADVLIKSNFTFAPIDLHELIKAYESNQFDLKKIALTKISSDNKNQSRIFNWIIKADKVELENLSDNLLHELSKQGHTIYIVNGEIGSNNILSCQTHQVSQSDILVLVPSNNDQLKLPKPAGYIDSRQSTQVTTIIENIKNEPRRIVMAAPAGAGKSTFIKKAQEAWLRNESGRQIAWICRIRLGKLRKKDNRKSLKELVTERIKEKLLSWQIKYIKNAIKNHQIVLILDGWDEVKEQQQEDCQEVLDKLFKYPNIIVTTRPNDFSSVPLLHFNYIKLLPFDLPRIKQYVQSFFGNSKFSKLVCDYLELPQAKELHDLIGVPMQCFLLCKVLYPYYQQWLNNSELAMPWHDQPLSKSRLYQLFISASLQEYLTKHEGMSTISPKKAFNRCKKELKRLQENALTQFFNTDNKFSYEEDLDDAISYFGFVDPITSSADSIIYNFKHQTYAEYFSAINLVAKLISKNSEKREFAINLIKDKRYIPRYRLVWQFMAGIISYGDLQLGKMPASADIERFWSALCMEPTDVIGIAHNALIKDCLRNSNWQAIEQTKYGEHLVNLYDEVNTNTSLLDIIQDSIDELPIANLKLTEENSLIELSKSKQTLAEMLEPLSKLLDDKKKDIFNYNSLALGQIEEMINELAKAAQTEEEKLILINYLLNTIKGKYPSNSLVIIAAIVEAIQESGIFNDQVEIFLRGALSLSKNKPKLRAAKALIKFGCAVDSNLFNALSTASRDKYNNAYTWIAREALAEIRKITHNSTELIQVMLSVIGDDTRELMVAVIFASLSKAFEVREQAKEAILKTSFLEKYRAYSYIALCHLSYDFVEKAINGIVENNLLDLIFEIPFLLGQTKDKQLATKTINFLFSQDSNYQILMIIRKLIDINLIDITNVRKYLISAFSNKNITVAAVQIFIDYGSVDDEVIEQLLNTPQSGFWLVNGGLPAISCLTDYFNKNISVFLIKIIQVKLYDYGVLNGMISCCKKFAESLPSESDNLMQYVTVLGELFVHLTGSGADLSQLEDLLGIVKVIENTRNLTAFAAVLSQCYSEKQQIQYLWLLMLFAQTKSFAITFDNEKITIIGSNLLITKEVGKENTLNVQQQLSAINEHLIKEDLIPKKVLGNNPTKTSRQLASVEALVSFSTVFGKNNKHGNVVPEKDIHVQSKNTLN
jgi:hypothetical protein